MTMSAIVAVAPVVEAEFVDQNKMNEMSLGLQFTVTGREQAGLGHLNGWNVYLVWGESASLVEAQTRWGVNMIPMGSWNMDGTRVGTYYETDPDGTTTLVGVPSVPIHAQLLDTLPDIVNYDADGNEVSRTRPTDLTRVPRVFGHGVREL